MTILLKNSTFKIFSWRQRTDKEELRKFYNGSQEGNYLFQNFCVSTINNKLIFKNTDSNLRTP